MSELAQGHVPALCAPSSAAYTNAADTHQSLVLLGLLVASAGNAISSNPALVPTAMDGPWSIPDPATHPSHRAELWHPSAPWSGQAPVFLFLPFYPPYSRSQPQ